MFVVQNISSQEISIPDLRVVLSPGEKVDLDMVSSRFYIEQSSSLKSYFKCDILKCLIKDSNSETYKIGLNNKIENNHSQEKNAATEIINAVKQLEEKLNKRIDEKVSQTSNQAGIDPNVLNQALAALQALASQNTKKPEEKQEPVQPIEASEMSNKKLIDIQKRTLNRISTNTESKVNYKEEKTDNNITKKTQELEDLL